MIIKEVYLKEWDWYVKIFRAIDNYYINEILGDLESIGCTGYELVKAENNITSGNKDSGLIYSNFLGRCSIIVLGISSSKEEWINICNCEKRYLGNHISKSLRIDVNSLEYKKLITQIDKKIFN